MTTRRYGTIVSHLTDQPEAAVELVRHLEPEVLVRLGIAVRDEQRRRAIADGDAEAVIADAFETGFTRDGLGVLPWISGPYVVCPGGLVGRSRARHRCRFVSVDDVWVWDSHDLITESKRSNPGPDEGFRAVALLPIQEGTALDVVTGRLRNGQHRVEKVVSFEVRGGELVEVSQRKVAPAGMQ